MKSMLFLLCLVMPAAPALAADTAPLPSESLYQVDARLTDQDGSLLAWSDLRGQPRVVSMFYTHCHLMCPMILESGKALQKQLAADGHRIEVDMLSLDPERDIPAVLKQTAADHRLDMRDWRLLRPAQNDVRALAASLDVRYRQQPDGSFSHTSVLVLLDADGRPLARSEVVGLQPDPAFVEQVRQTLAAR